MDVQSTKSFLIEWLQQLQDQTLMKELETIAKSQSEGDWWNELPNTIRDRINEGNQDFLEGRVISHEEATRRFSKKFEL